MSGSIEVITGPMFAGKTEELIRRLRRVQIARIPFLVFKPALDTRYSLDHIVSHSDWRVEAGTITAAGEILERVRPDTQVVAIDEGQFLDAGIIPVAQQLAGAGRRVIIAALDLDYRGEPFEPVPRLLAVADEVAKLTAVCVPCGQPAHFTQRLGSHQGQVLIGAGEQYEARCRNCFQRGV